MKGKTFWILLVAAGVLVALAFLRLGDQQQAGDADMGQKLFTDLQVNQIANITIADAENRVTLVKGDHAWQVKDRSGYPADFGELRDMVVKLSRLKIGRRFSGTAESIARLSLLAPSAPEEQGRGVQMTLKDSSGKVMADVILGQTRNTDAGGSGGQYLKKADDDTVFLVDGSFRFLKTSPADWLQDEILNIKADDVASVNGFMDDSVDPAYTLARAEKGEAPQLSPVPSGRRADSAKIDQVFDALAPLTLDDVTLVDENSIPVDGDVTRLVYRLYDGRQITIFPASDGQEIYQLRVVAEEIAGETADTGTTALAKSENSAAHKAADAKPAETDKNTQAPVVKTAKQINDELGPWVFSIKKWQYDSLITQAEALLESVEEKAAGGTS